MVEEITSLSDLRVVYPLIEEGLAAHAAKLGETHQQFAPDVYRRIADGLMRLAITTHDGELWGWATFMLRDELDGGRTSVSEHLYLRPGAPPHLTLECIDYWEKAARAEGASSIQFMSPRVGWERRLAASGFRPVTRVYVKEL